MTRFGSSIPDYKPVLLVTEFIKFTKIYLNFILTFFTRDLLSVFVPSRKKVPVTLACPTLVIWRVHFAIVGPNRFRTYTSIVYMMYLVYYFFTGTFCKHTIHPSYIHHHY
jgi:hypothetical protein